MMRVIIDRFEGDLAVCERPDRTMMNIPRNSLPPEAKEGDVLIIENNCISLDVTDTADRKKAVEERMRKLWRK